MNSSVFVRRFATLACLVCAALVVGCGGSTTGAGDDAGSTGSATGGSGKATSDLKIGLVTDIGGLNDRSFNTLANQGLMQAEEELGVQGDVLESKSAGDYVANLSRFATQKYDLIISVGFLMGDATKQVASKFPDSKFAIIDFSYGETPVPNVQGVLFKEEEAGYLAGALAGMVESDGKLKGLNSAKVVSSVGGQKIPPVDKFIAGFQAGVKKFCKDCKTVNAYSQDFVAQDKCKEQALAQIGAGSDIVFQVAGGCGLGALDAAKSKGVWGVGVDADQGYLGSHILTSAIKRVDKAVFDSISAVGDGSFSGGTDVVLGLAEDGVGLGEVSSAAAEYESRLEPVIADLKAGKIEVPTEV